MILSSFQAVEISLPVTNNGMFWKHSRNNTIANFKPKQRKKDMTDN